MHSVPPPEQFAARPTSGRSFGAAVLLVACAALFAVLSARPLTHSELRYVAAGSEMAAGGDWVVPHLSYVPYFEKPILTYWLEAATQLALGMSPVAVRVPSILACVAIVGTTYALGRHMRGAAFGLGAAALLAAGVMFEEMGSVITTDPLFSALLAAAWYAFWRHDRSLHGDGEVAGRRRVPWIWLFWTALGFAVLTKGPLGLALVGTSVGSYLLLDGRFREAIAMKLVRGALVVVAINLPWSILVWQRDPRFLHFFYVRQNFQALIDSRVNHGGPVWYYLPILAGAFLPFALLVTWALGAELWTTFRDAVHGALARSAAPARPDAARLYLGCMVLPPLLFLSVSASKLGTYVVPLLAGAALLAAWHVADRLARPTPVLRWSLAVQAAIVVVAGAALPFVLKDELRAQLAEALAHEGPTLAVIVAAFLGAMIAGGVAMARGRILGGMAIAAAGSVVAVLLANHSALDIGGERASGSLMQKLMAVRRTGEPVIVASPVVDDYSIVLALGERPLIWGDARELGMGHFTEVTAPDVPIPPSPYDVGGSVPLPQNPWLVDDRDLRARWSGTERVWLVGRPRDVAKIRAIERLHVYVLTESDSRSIATNLPLTESR